MLAAARAVYAHGLEWLANTDCTHAAMETVEELLPAFARRFGTNNFASFAVVDAAGPRPILRARQSDKGGWQQVCFLHNAVKHCPENLCTVRGSTPRGQKCEIVLC